MLWEVNLLNGRAEDPTQDFNLLCLWDSFERELLRRFPETRQIVTPDLTPDLENYDDSQWEAFLAKRGYSPHKEDIYRKLVGD